MAVLDLFRLDGKVAIVTGGGRGLGQQIAQAYVEAGAKVVICSRRLANCEKVKKELEAISGEVLALSLDVTDPQSITKVVDDTLQHFGRIDILVNNSGATWGAPSFEMPYDAWMKVIQTNLTGTFLMAQAVGRQMKENGGGKIINIASVAGLRGTVPEGLDAVGYSTSKGGVINLTRDLAVKWARHNIYVNAIAPGFFPTQMTKDVLKVAGERVLDDTPLHRFGGERDLQGAALFFASAASDFVTGQILAVDGGTTAK